ncbi:fumarylacetoacetate hydrolase family protein [Arthrobacter sp. 2RAF6]|jgi:acylpyruvate hydrolase|uniref:fumarylacetoacetate hydrolase family protein n=1 Tax=unclassified Arthrobacter TaxID=235627 RepID=UPI003F8DC2BE
MKVAIFGPNRRVGVIRNDKVVDANGAYAKYLAETTEVARPQAQADADVPSELGAFIAEGKRSLQGAQAAVDYLWTKAQDDRGILGEQLFFGLGETELHAPVAGGSRIFCALANFFDHMEAASKNSSREDTASVLDRLVQGGPKYFLKDHRAVSADGQPVRYPARTQRLDYEAEVAIVIGKRGRDIGREDALPYIWGYTLHNDWSVRDNVSFGPDFMHSKNFDTSATIGPWIVVNEGLDPQDIPIECRVNGEVRQSGNTKSMVHDFSAFIHHLSADTTLYPGDLISSGTPKGTAIDSSQQQPDGSHPDTLFAKPGDVVEVSSSLIGTLRNEVVKASN